MAELNLGIDIKVSPTRLFEAITNPGDLTSWFTEHAEVSLADNRYNFWGRFTPGNPTQEEGQHRISRVIPNKLVEFEWRLRDTDSIVQFEIHETSGGCVLTMYHQNMPVASPSQSSIQDFWSHTLEGLRHWLETGQVYDLMDYSETRLGDIGITIEIDVPPGVVFHALTDADQMERWIGSRGSIDPKPGGKIDFGWGMGPIKILEIEPDKKLSYSWQWEGEPQSVATWSLDGSGGKTRLSIVQSGFAPDRNGEDYYIGWYKFVSRLKTMLEQGPEWERIKVYSNKERLETTTTTIDEPISNE